MRSKFWTLLLTGVAVTALAGFSPTTQDAEAGLFSRLRAHFHGDCGSCSGEVVASCCPTPCPAPAPSCCPAPAPTCCPAPCDACGSCSSCGCEADCDTDHDDDCDD